MKALLLAATMMMGGAALAQTPPGDGITQQGTNPADMACTPPGYNVGLSVYPQCAAVPRPTHGDDYPPCSRDVTDHCVQTYAREENR